MNNQPPEWAIQQQIRELAYFKWEEAGRPDEMHDHFWLEAEKEVRRQYDSFLGCDKYQPHIDNIYQGLGIPLDRVKQP
jgi:hypothetical protein